MSCTLSKMMANRLNAMRSTGPRSAEGKARSSRNARSHGLSRAVGAAPPSEWSDLIESRKSSWRNSYRPADPAQDYLFDRLVAESVRLDQCEARITAARIEFADRAGESWDDDRRAEVAEFASKLIKAPDHIQPLLLQSKHGVEWLLDAWDEVAESLRYHDHWTAPNWQRAMDLLGLSIHARGSSTPNDLHPSDVSPVPGLVFIHDVMDALRSRLADILDDRDSRARLDAELGLELSDPKPIRLLERYAADARRRVRWAMTELRKLQSSSPASASTSTPDSSPTLPPLASVPEPRPDRRKPRQERTLTPGEPPARNEPIPGETPTRSEPIPAESTRPIAPRPLLQPTSTAPVLLNRRARRAQAAAKRRLS